jgi:outer membrane receptor protein involved in Fe transport
VRVTVGGELQHHFLVHQFAEDEAPHPINTTFLDDDRQFQVGAAYVLGDFSPTPRVKLSIGGRLDTYSTFGTSVNPRVAAIFKPYDGGNVKVMAGKAFRAPSIYELFYRASQGQITNPNLGPEDIYSGEIEYSHRFSPFVTGLVAAYANYITGLIALRNVEEAGVSPDQQPYQYQNTKTPVATVGAEAELRREWKDGWMIAASYSLQRSQYLASDSLGDLLAFAPNHQLREVPNSPSHLAGLKGAAPILQRALTAMTRVSFEGPRFDRNDSLGDPPQTKTDAAVIWDLVLSGVEPRWGVRYALGAYNLFDWRWFAPVSPEFRQNTIVQNGRTFLASASVTF